jgi:hypothetical protein
MARLSPSARRERARGHNKTAVALANKKEARIPWAVWRPRAHVLLGHPSHEDMTHRLDGFEHHDSDDAPVLAGGRTCRYHA